MLAATAVSDTIATAHSKTVGKSLKFLLKRNSQYLNPIVTTHTTLSSHSRRMITHRAFLPIDFVRQTVVAPRQSHEKHRLASTVTTHQSSFHRRELHPIIMSSSQTVGYNELISIWVGTLELVSFCRVAESAVVGSEVSNETLPSFTVVSDNRLRK